VIEIRGLRKNLSRRWVLDGLDLDVRQGETLVVLGPSGTGKSVLLKHIIGLMQPDEGSIRIDGEEIVGLGEKALNEVRRRFGMLFQGAALFDSMTVFDNVAFPLREGRRGAGIPAAEVRRRVVEKLKVVDLGEEVLGRWPSELSGGMRKRVGLARALVCEPQIVLYDEPTTGLDPITASYVDEMILHAKERLGITSMVISHDIASAFRVADRVAVLYDGRFAAVGTPAEVRASKEPFVQRFLALWFEKQ